MLIKKILILSFFFLLFSCNSNLDTIKVSDQKITEVEWKNNNFQNTGNDLEELKEKENVGNKNEDKNEGGENNDKDIIIKEKKIEIKNDKDIIDFFSDFSLKDSSKNLKKEEIKKIKIFFDKDINSFKKDLKKELIKTKDKDIKDQLDTKIELLDETKKMLKNVKKEDLFIFNETYNSFKKNIVNKKEDKKKIIGDIVLLKISDIESKNTKLQIGKVKNFLDNIDYTLGDEKESDFLYPIMKKKIDKTKDEILKTKEERKKEIKISKNTFINILKKAKNIKNIKEKNINIVNINNIENKTIYFISYNKRDYDIDSILIFYNKYKREFPSEIKISYDKELKVYYLEEPFYSNIDLEIINDLEKVINVEEGKIIPLIYTSYSKNNDEIFFSMMGLLYSLKNNDEKQIDNLLSDLAKVKGKTKKNMFLLKGIYK